MHAHYLAHCDIKSQNVLVEVSNNVPSCYLTDFGIAQILSERIIATKEFNVINLRGLSVSYAAPEALNNFRSKKYSRTDFRRYDIYSLACMTFEVLTKQMPWS
jgi:serine/threonine protein kinase